MKFEFSEDQKLFQEAFSAVLSDKCDATVVRKVWETQNRAEGLWEALAELGALGIQAPEEMGGLGFSEIELILLMEEAGRYAMPEPFLEHASVAVPTLAACLENESPESKNSVFQEYLEKAISGELVITTVYSPSSYVVYGEWADMFLLINEKDSNIKELHLVSKDDVKLHPQKSLETPRKPMRVEWKPSADSLLAEGKDFERAMARGVVAASGMCLGLAQHLLDATIEYVSEREQFGKPVGSQQAVKHHLADVAIAIEHARPSVYMAAWHLSSLEPSLTSSLEAKTLDIAIVSSAKVLASKAADLAAKKSLQCQGAIGYTVENDTNFWMKKALVTASSWGSSSFHLEQIAKTL